MFNRNPRVRNLEGTAFFASLLHEVLLNYFITQKSEMSHSITSLFLLADMRTKISIEVFIDYRIL